MRSASGSSQILSRSHQILSHITSFNPRAPAGQLENYHIQMSQPTLRPRALWPGLFSLSVLNSFSSRFFFFFSFSF